jgi:hypothetical protein
MTLRDYFTNRFAPRLECNDKHALGLLYAAILFLEEYPLYNRDRLDVLRISESDLVGMVNSAVKQGYSVRTAKNWAQVIRRVLRDRRPKGFPIGGGYKEVSYPAPAEPPNRQMLMLVYMRYIYFADRPMNRNYERSLWCAIDKLSELLKEDACLRHFTDAAIAGMLSLCRRQGLCENTIRRYRKSICSLWRHAAANKLVAQSKNSRYSRADELHGCKVSRFMQMKRSGG